MSLSGELVDIEKALLWLGSTLVAPWQLFAGSLVAPGWLLGASWVAYWWLLSKNPLMQQIILWYAQEHALYKFIVFHECQLTEHTTFQTLNHYHPRMINLWGSRASRECYFNR